MSKSIPRTFITYVEDKPGVLNRVVSLFRRRGYNIESLTVGRSAREDVSRITLVIHADEDMARRIQANLYKLVNVLWVKDVTEGATVVRDLALIKVKTEASQRPAVMQLCEVFQARVVDITPDAMIVEITSTQDKIDGLIDVLRPFGIAEMVRTGAIAMTRGVQEDPLTKDERSAESAAA